MKKIEKQIFLGIFIFALILWSIMSWLRPHNYGSICIQVDGEIFGTYSLSKDQVISIGNTNVCEIKNGQAAMTEATCPDHLCMKQGAIDDTGGLIVCLPNKITIEGEQVNTGPDAPEVDAIAW